MANRHTLAVLVENKPGVLTRVAALFARRAFNIKSLAVGETEHPEISRMTIIVDADEAPLEQVVKQLNKLVNVLKVVEMEPEESVESCRNLKRCWRHWSPSAFLNSSSRAPWRSAAGRVRSRIN